MAAIGPLLGESTTAQAGSAVTRTHGETPATPIRDSVLEFQNLWRLADETP